MRTLLLVVVLVFVTAAAFADDAPLPPLLSWRAPQGCGDELAIRRRVVELAGNEPEAHEPYAVVVVEQGDAGVTAQIDLNTPEGVTRRTRHAASCDALGESVAQLLAMAWRTALREPKLLDWKAPEECPDRLEVRAEISARAHRRHDDGFAPFATVEVSKDDTGYRATVALSAGLTFETREVRGATCAEAADAVAWMIALAWMPKPVVVPVERASQPQPRVPSPWTLHTSLRSAFDAGTLPGPDVGFGVALGLVHDRGIEAELSGTRWVQRFDPVMAGSSAGVDVSLTAVAAQVCIERWFACAGIEGGSVSGHAVMLQDARSASLLWLAATAGARKRVALGRTVDAVLDAGLVVPLGRPQFTFEGGDVVFRPAVVAARFGLAIEFAPFE